MRAPEMGSKEAGSREQNAPAFLHCSSTLRRQRVPISLPPTSLLPDVFPTFYRFSSLPYLFASLPRLSSYSPLASRHCLFYPPHEHTVTKSQPIENKARLTFLPATNSHFLSVAVVGSGRRFYRCSLLPYLSGSLPRLSGICP